MLSLLILSFALISGIDTDLIPGATCTLKKDITFIENNSKVIVSPEKSNYRYHFMMVPTNNRREITKESNFILFTVYRNQVAWRNNISVNSIFYALEKLEADTVWMFKSVESGTYLYVAYDYKPGILKSPHNPDSILIHDMVNIIKNGEIKVVK